MSLKMPKKVPKMGLKWPKRVKMGQHGSKREKKKVCKKKYRPKMGPNHRQTTFYRNRNLKKWIFDRQKNRTQINPKSAMSCPCPLQCRAAAVRIDAAPNARQFRKNRKKKNVPELHLCEISRIFEAFLVFWQVPPAHAAPATP